MISGENGITDDLLVIPINSGVAADVTPWQLLAQRQAITAQAVPAHPGPAHDLRVAAAGSALARQLASVIPQLSSTQAAGLKSGSLLMRVELPTGATVDSLVKAAGGGFRGMTRSAGSSTKIGGHARLFPAAGATAGGIALGPAVALIAFGVAAEAVASHQLNAKLDRIQESLERIEARERDRQEGVLASMVDVLESATSALIDRIEIPSVVGSGATRNDLRQLKHAGLKRLERWEAAAKEIERDNNNWGFDFGRLSKMIDLDKKKDGADFAHDVSVLHRALVLDSHVEALTLTQAALKNPGADLDHFGANVRAAMVRNENYHRRMRAAVTTIAAEPLITDVKNWMFAVPKLARTRRTMVLAARLLLDEHEAPPMINANGSQVFHAQWLPGGSVKLSIPAVAN